MGLTEIQKEMIRGIATNNMLKARQGALGALNEDTTQKNKNFVARYKSILTSEHGSSGRIKRAFAMRRCFDVI